MEKEVKPCVFDGDNVKLESNGIFTLKAASFGAEKPLTHIQMVDFFKRGFTLHCSLSYKDYQIALCKMEPHPLSRSSTVDIYLYANDDVKVEVNNSIIAFENDMIKCFTKVVHFAHSPDYSCNGAIYKKLRALLKRWNAKLIAFSLRTKR